MTNNVNYTVEKTQLKLTKWTQLPRYNSINDNTVLKSAKKPRWDLRLTEKTHDPTIFSMFVTIRKYGYAERCNWCLDTIEIIEISKFISLLTTGSTYPKTIYQKKLIILLILKFQRAQTPFLPVKWQNVDGCWFIRPSCCVRLEILTDFKIVSMRDNHKINANLRILMTIRCKTVLKSAMVSLL